MKEAADFSVLVGKTLTKIIVKNNGLIFYIDNGEEYYLGGDVSPAFYKKDILGGSLKDMIGTVTVAEIVPKMESIKFSLNNPIHNVPIDPEFPWGHYLLKVGNSYKDRIMIRWFSPAKVLFDFYSHQVKFYRIK